MATGERRAIPLDAVRADGWFERLARNVPAVVQLCDVLGERFTAFAVVADVRVTAVALDPERRDASMIDFQVGDSERTHRLPLGEFRRRVAAAMLAEEAAGDDEPPELGTEALQRFIGVVPILLAPVFGIRLLRLWVGGDPPPSLVVEAGGAEQEMPLSGFRELIREQVRAEVEEAQSGGGFAIDVAVVEQAAEAHDAGDWEQVIRLLGDWPGPLSMLIRTPEGQQLGADGRAAVARGLGLLGTAYVETGRAEWAEEIMRLGIQWSRDGRVAGDLFRRLGNAQVSQGRAGEAIGFYRRALALGAAPVEVLPVLARCFAARGRYVAAAACADEAEAAGVDAASLSSLRDELRAHLGDAWTRFREQVPLPSGGSDTVPPPGRG
ncbi:MAG: hypothetical protein ACODAU_02145 [Myxococcota bacterium]